MQLWGNIVNRTRILQRKLDNYMRSKWVNLITRHLHRLRFISYFRMLLFNTNYGYLEGLVRGFKNGLLNQSEYQALTQCDSLEDLKLHLSVSCFCELVYFFKYLLNLSFHAIWPHFSVVLKFNTYLCEEYFCLAKNLR